MFVLAFLLCAAGSSPDPLVGLLSGSMTPHCTTQNNCAVFSGKLSPADLSPAGHFFEGFVLVAQAVAEAFQHDETMFWCAACRVFWRFKKDCGRCGNPCKAVGIND